MSGASRCAAVMEGVRELYDGVGGAAAAARRHRGFALLRLATEGSLVALQDSRC